MAARGYWNNRFEVEARAFADANLTQLHALLARTPPPPAAVPYPSSASAAVETSGQGDEQRPQGERRGD